MLALLYLRLTPKRNVTIGVEGQNGMLSDVRGTVFYYWHGGDGLDTWGRIVMGSTQQMDDDITPTSATNPFTNFEGVADRIYLHTRPYLMQLTDPELLDDGRWAGGGTSTTWPYGGGTITYSKLGSRFVPAVLDPGLQSSPDAPTALDPWKVCEYANCERG